jgi:dephospho-CoA kinase
MLVIGLTGNYGMGKSTVLPVFRKLGAAVADSDEIVDSLLRKEDVIRKIRDLLGDDVLFRNGGLNKKKVAKLIFRNAILKNSLEEILHPIVFERILCFLDSVKKTHRIAVVEIPLLYEKGYEDRFDRTITVFADENKALSRLEKKGLRRKEAELRLHAQMPIEEKVRKSDFTIDNNGSMKKTTAQVEEIYGQLLKEEKDGDHNRP